MYCKAEPVIKKFRYRILTIEGKYYILDVDRPFIVYFFPFIFWLLPHTVYQIDKNIMEQLKLKKVKNKRSNGIYAGLVGAGIGYPIYKLFIAPLIDSFKFEIEFNVKLYIIIISVIIALLLKIKISRTWKRNLNNIICLVDTKQKRLKIWPKSFVNIIKLPLFFFILFGCMLFFSVFLFLNFGDVLMLIFIPISLFLFLMVNLFVILKGDYRYKWLN